MSRITSRKARTTPLKLLGLRLGLPDEYIFKQCDEGEEIIAESILTGERIRWNGQYWEKYN